MRHIALYAARSLPPSFGVVANPSYDIEDLEICSSDRRLGGWRCPRRSSLPRSLHASSWRLSCRRQQQAIDTQCGMRNAESVFSNQYLQTCVAVRPCASSCARREGKCGIPIQHSASAAALNAI